MGGAPRRCLLLRCHGPRRGAAACATGPIAGPGAGTGAPVLVRERRAARRGWSWFLPRRMQTAGGVPPRSCGRAGAAAAAEGRASPSASRAWLRLDLQPVIGRSEAGGAAAAGGPLSIGGRCVNASLAWGQARASKRRACDADCGHTGSHLSRDVTCSEGGQRARAGGVPVLGLGTARQRHGGHSDAQVLAQATTCQIKSIGVPFCHPMAKGISIGRSFCHILCHIAILRAKCAQNSQKDSYSHSLCQIRGPIERRATASLERAGGAP